MSINSDKESKIIPTTSENYFSRSGADIACINCQCGYKDAFETDDTSKPRSLKTQIHSNTTYLKLQEIFNEL